MIVCACGAHRDTLGKHRKVGRFRESFRAGSKRFREAPGRFQKIPEKALGGTGTPPGNRTGNRNLLDRAFPNPPEPPPEPSKTPRTRPEPPGTHPEPAPRNLSRNLPEPTFRNLPEPATEPLPEPSGTRLEPEPTRNRNLSGTFPNLPGNFRNLPELRRSLTRTFRNPPCHNL